MKIKSFLLHSLRDLIRGVPEGIHKRWFVEFWRLDLKTICWRERSPFLSRVPRTRIIVRRFVEQGNVPLRWLRMHNSAESREILARIALFKICISGCCHRSLPCASISRQKGKIIAILTDVIFFYCWLAERCVSEHTWFGKKLFREGIISGIISTKRDTTI